MLLTGALTGGLYLQSRTRGHWSLAGWLASVTASPLGCLTVGGELRLSEHDFCGSRSEMAQAEGLCSMGLHIESGSLCWLQPTTEAFGEGPWELNPLTWSSLTVSSLAPTPHLDRKLMQSYSVAFPRNPGASSAGNSTGQLHPCEEGWRFP